MLSSLYILDENGVPVNEPDPVKWGQWMESQAFFNSKRRVDSTKLRKFWISTVFLGLDHNFGEGPPLLYETMVFKRNLLKSGCYRELRQQRYSTKEEALSGHADNVNRALCWERVFINKSRLKKRGKKDKDDDFDRWVRAAHRSRSRWLSDHPLGAVSRSAERRGSHDRSG